MKQKRELITKFVRKKGRLTPYSPDRNHKVLCPVCGCVTFDDYYVCNICNWEFEFLDLDKNYSPANLASAKNYRKKFLRRVSKNIRREYRRLIKTTKNKYILFDMEFVSYCFGLYENFYKNEWFDNDTKEFVANLAYGSLEVVEPLGKSAKEMVHDFVKEEKQN